MKYEFLNKQFDKLIMLFVFLVTIGLLKFDHDTSHTEIWKILATGAFSSLVTLLTKSTQSSPNTTTTTTSADSADKQTVVETQTEVK